MFSTPQESDGSNTERYGPQAMARGRNETQRGKEVSTDHFFVIIVCNYPVPRKIFYASFLYTFCPYIFRQLSGGFPSVCWRFSAGLLTTFWRRSFQNATTSLAITYSKILLAFLGERLSDQRFLALSDAFLRLSGTFWRLSSAFRRFADSFLAAFLEEPSGGRKAII